MASVDRLSNQSGIDMWRLMQNAGMAVAACALRHYPGALRFVVLCGPGNNGGDGYVAASALLRAGAEVVVFSFGQLPETGDAAKALKQWPDAVTNISLYQPRPGDVIIDALFGAGLSRPLDAELCRLIRTVGDAGIAVVSADLPSGIDGRTGAFPQSLGGGAPAFKATHTVTFMCPKPGHVLLPGRDYCGEVEVFDIGIPKRIVLSQNQNVYINDPELWQHLLPASNAADHKYSRGHLVVFSGPVTATGAARLSAHAGLTAGAGAVTLLSPSDALAINASHLTAVMLKEASDANIASLLGDPRVRAFLLGPGFGVSGKIRQLALVLAEKPLVLDADGISSFRNEPDMLFSVLNGHGCQYILTPHEGEFARLFPDVSSDQTLSKIDRARIAAQRSNAVVVYKGADTIIASPNGRAFVNCNAPPWLATAGSGDVLAGIAAGFLAQGMPAFEAAAAAVWLHAEAGSRAGQGLTAETLLEAVRPFQAASG